MELRTATRRALIRDAIGLGATASLLAASAPAEAVAAAGAETAAIAHVLVAERVAVIAYRQVLARNILSGAASTQVQRLLAQEQQHVKRLEQALARLGAAVPAGPADLTAAQTFLSQHSVSPNLGAIPTEHDALRLLINVESLTEGAYFTAIPQLVHPAVIQTSLEMMGSDAQHWTALSGLQHDGDVVLSVPYPFVQGTS
jgi:hypothetical protein